MNGLFSTGAGERLTPAYRGKPRDEQHGEVRLRIPEPGRHGEPAQDGHPDVSNHEPELVIERGGDCEPFLPIPGQEHHITGVGEQPRHRMPHEGIVIHHQDEPAVRGLGPHCRSLVHEEFG